MVGCSINTRWVFCPAFRAGVHAGISFPLVTFTLAAHFLTMSHCWQWHQSSGLRSYKLPLWESSHVTGDQWDSTLTWQTPHVRPVHLTSKTVQWAFGVIWHDQARESLSTSVHGLAKFHSSVCTVWLQWASKHVNSPSSCWGHMLLLDSVVSDQKKLVNVLSFVACTHDGVPISSQHVLGIHDFVPPLLIWVENALNWQSFIVLNWQRLRFVEKVEQIGWTVQLSQWHAFWHVGQCVCCSDNVSHTNWI